jgi:hypothetical protein
VSPDFSSVTIISPGSYQYISEGSYQRVPTEQLLQVRYSLTEQTGSGKVIPGPELTSQQIRDLDPQNLYGST